VLVEAQVTVKGSRAAIWAAITSIENAAEIIRAPLAGLVRSRR